MIIFLYFTIERQNKKKKRKKGTSGTDKKKPYNVHIS